jgi:hypothetical protein
MACDARHGTAAPLDRITERRRHALSHPSRRCHPDGVNVAMIRDGLVTDIAQPIEIFIP